MRTTGSGFNPEGGLLSQAGSDLHVENEVTSMIRNWTAHLFVLTVVFALAGCGKDPEVAKREYVKSGQQYVAAGKYKEAVIEFRNAVQQDPRYGEARFALAGALLKTSDFQGAYREYARSADLLPNDI